MRHEDFHFFDPWGEIDASRNHLPHWQQEGARLYFVTWRLADSIPQEKLDRHHEERNAWLRRHPKESWDGKVEAEYHRLFSAKIDRWLDAGSGSCVLREPENAAILKSALLHFEGDRSAMVSFVIMPNHVHLLFVLRPGWRLEEVVHSWKSFSAKQINRRTGRGGVLWQKDYFDRLVRDSEHLGNCVRYIRTNPEKAGLRSRGFVLWESEIAKSIG